MEAMAIEQLLLRRWEIEGFWGQNRVRISGNNYWREIDAIAIGKNSKGFVLRVGEVKVRGTPEHIFPMDDYVIIYDLESDGTAEKWLGNWGKFIDTCCCLYNDFDDASILPGLPNWSELKKFEIWFVFNGWEVPGTDALKTLESGIRSLVIKKWGYSQKYPAALNNLLSVNVVTTRDLIFDTIKKTRDIIENGRGVRFGDPFLDSIRELLRYLRPKFYEKPSVSGNDAPTPSQLVENCRDETIKRLSEAFGLDLNI